MDWIDAIGRQKTVSQLHAHMAFRKGGGGGWAGGGLGQDFCRDEYAVILCFVSVVGCRAAVDEVIAG